MKFLLDTNTCVHYLNGRAPAILRHLQHHPPHEVVLCSIVKSELYFGALKSKNPNATLDDQNKFLSQFQSLAFDDDAAMIHARICSELNRQGTVLRPNDMLIAAIVLANDLTLVTHNTREFSRITELRLEDWEVDIPSA